MKNAQQIYLSLKIQVQLKLFLLAHSRLSPIIFTAGSKVSAFILHETISTSADSGLRLRHLLPSRCHLISPRHRTRALRRSE
jgi:hypothetical protein